MSLNTNFDEIMENGVTALVAGADVNNITSHATFQAGPEIFNDEVTQDSLGVHLNFLNNLVAQSEQATAQLSRAAFDENNENTSFDSTLDLGYAQIQSQHFLKQDVGDNTLYGQSVTSIDYNYTDDLNNYREQMSNSNSEAAAKLFG